MDNYKKYTQELGEILKTFDVNKLDNFIEINKKNLGDNFYNDWSATPSKTKEMAMCEMIIARTDLSYELKLKAQEKLEELKNDKF